MSGNAESEFTNKELLVSVEQPSSSGPFPDQVVHPTVLTYDQVSWPTQGSPLLCGPSHSGLVAPHADDPAELAALKGLLRAQLVQIATERPEPAPGDC